MGGLKKRTVQIRNGKNTYFFLGIVQIAGWVDGSAGICFLCIKIGKTVRKNGRPLTTQWVNQTLWDLSIRIGPILYISLIHILNATAALLCV